MRALRAKGVTDLRFLVSAGRSGVGAYRACSGPPGSLSRRVRGRTRHGSAAGILPWSPSLPAGVERAGFRGRLRAADVAFVVDESADRIGLGLVVAGADQHGRRFVKAAAFAVVAPPAD